MTECVVATGELVHWHSGSLTGLQGYELNEDELSISLDEFKSRFTNDGVPEYV